MWKSNIPIVSRRVGRSSGDVMARIVRFDSDSDMGVMRSDRRLSGTTSRTAVKEVPAESSIDFDSCLSPSFTAHRSQSDATELRGSFIGYLTPIRRSVSDEEVSDYDSCVSPVSTPRWTVREKEDFKRCASSKSFKDLHKMLLGGYITHFDAHPNDGQKKLEACPRIHPKTVIVSGSFNPLHHGHESLARRAVEHAKNASGEYFFEISTINVDKGPVSAAEMERRVDYIISRGHPCLLTNATFFDAKAELFPHSIFAIGFDTYTRVVNPKYYPRVTGGLDATMARVEANDCEFFVGGRLTEGVYKALAPAARKAESDNEFDLSIIEVPAPHDYRGRTVCTLTDDQALLDCQEEPMSPIFSGITGFRHDISSTEIRAGKTFPTV